MRKILTNFRGGEVSDRVAGRMDSADYDQTCRTLENFLLHPSGGADLRPGTYYCGKASDSLIGGNCEEAIAPHIRGDAPSVSDCTFERDGTQKHGGSYSYKLTRTTGGASPSHAYLIDNTDIDDLHGLVPGRTYRLSAHIFVPSAGGCAVSEVRFVLDYYDSGAWTHNLEVGNPVVDSWSYLATAEVAIPATATGVIVSIYISSSADDTEFIYVDDVCLENTQAVHRLIPFVRSKTEAYVLELSNLLIRVWHDGALVQSGGSDLEITSPWAEADLFALKYVQTEDAMYFAHPSYQLVHIDFISETNWVVLSADYLVWFFVTHGTSPYITGYGYAADTFPKIADFTDLPTGTGRSCSFSADGRYFAVGHDFSTRSLTLYKRSGITAVKLSDPASLPTGAVYGVSFSPDGLFLAVTDTASPYIFIYSRSADTFTKLGNPADLPLGSALCCAFSEDSTYLAVGYQTVSPYLIIYKRSGTTFTKLADVTDVPDNLAYGCSFSSDGTYLAVAHNLSPYISIYKRSGDIFTKLSNPGTIPTGTGYACVFSPDGNYLAVCSSATPYVLIYKREGDTFTKVANPGTLPTGAGNGCSWSCDSLYLAVSHTTTPFVTIYKRDGDTFTKLTNPTDLPVADGNSCIFSPSGWMQVPWDSNTYPSALTFHEQRLVVARGRKAWASRVGFPQDFSQDVADTSYGYEYKFAANQLEDVLWMLTKNHNIILGSGMGEWLMTGGDAPLTAANVYVDRVSAHGSANIAAIMANESILFVQDGSQRLREFLYSQERGGYISPDLSRWADHIGRKNFVEMAWQRSPASLLWGVRGNGELAALTLDRNYSIQAWHRHPTDGTVESIAVIPGTAEDVVYMAVKRSLDDINLLDHADCESTDAPHITGDGASVGDCTFARSNDFAYAGIYSYKLTKTVAAGTAGYALFTDNSNTNDLHEMAPGKTYRLSACLYSPTSGGPSNANEIYLVMNYYDAGEWTAVIQRLTTKDTWEYIAAEEITIPATATGTYAGIFIASTAEDTEYFYVDNLKLTCVNPGGNPKKYIEYLKPIDWGDDEEDCFLVDCGLTVDHTATTDSIEGATDAEPVVITATGHPFVNDEFVKITGVVGMTELNGNTYMVKNKAANTFELYETDGTTPLDGTGFTTYVSGGTCVKVVKVVPGLTHLEGETLAVYADGVELGDEEVYVGSITIDEYASKIHVGLPYTGKLRPQRLGQFMKSKIQETVLMLYKTRGGKIGSNENNLNAIQHASSALLTGTVDTRVQGTFSQEGDLIIVQDQPLPMTVLAIAAELNAN